MSDEKPQEAAAKSSKGMSKLITFLVVILVAAGGGFATYAKVVAPLFAEPKEEEQAEEPKDIIPETATYVEFDEAQAAVKADTPDGPSSVLMYTVSMMCSNLETAELVEKNKPWFVSKLSELHRNHTRSEVNDPQMEKEILKMAVEECNSILRRLLPEPNEEVRIIDVLHLKYTVFDL